MKESWRHGLKNGKNQRIYTIDILRGTVKTLVNGKLKLWYALLQYEALFFTPKKVGIIV